MKPQDSAAETITFGVEIETTVPLSAGIEVGGYHRGSPVTGGVDAVSGEMAAAPVFMGRAWRADYDASIVARAGREVCEFVSPVLSGTDGVVHLLDFVRWAKSIGANVNASCGLHITVGVRSIIGTEDPAAMAAFARRLAHITRWHAKSLFGQTGTGRHLGIYSRLFADDVGELMKKAEKTESVTEKAEACRQCGRGMVNFRKLYSHGVIEFRVFAGTLNTAKMLHHLATVLGLCRRAAEVECLGGFRRNAKQQKRTATARDALRYLWDYLGWTGSRRDVALGLFGELHGSFAAYRRVAERMCRRFDSRFPNACL